MKIQELLQEIKLAALATLALLVILCGLYPLVVWGIAQAAFPGQANGSLVRIKGQIVGSGLLAQNFSGPQYFHPRPSAAGDTGFDGTSSGGSNLGPLSQKLSDQVKERVEKYRTENNLPAGTPVHYARLRDFPGRGRAIDTVLGFAEQSKMRRQVRTASGAVCEELLMNALYDAPVDADGRPLFADVDPHDRIETRSPRPVSIRYAVTDQLFAVAVRDRFGRLAKNTILSYIEKCIRSPTQIDRKTYGAGLGLYLVANAAASYTVNVAYGIATEVVCTFDRGAKTPLRLLGMFVHPGGADMLKRGPTPETAAGQQSGG